MYKNIVSLVHLGCYNKTPQTGWLINNRNFSHSPGGWKSEISVAIGSGCRLLTVSSQGRRDAKTLSGVSLIRH